MLNHLFSLENRTVIVTGGAQGIGKEVAKHLAGVGANVVIFDMQIEKATETAKEIETLYDKRALAYKVDVTNPSNCAEAIEKADKELGDIHYLFNNAGIVLQKPVIDLDRKSTRLNSSHVS